MPVEPTTKSVAELKRMRRDFTITLTEKEKAFLIEAKTHEDISLSEFIRNAAIDTAEKRLKRKFREE